MALKFNLRKAAELIFGMTAMLLASLLSFSAAAATVTYPQSYTTGWNLAGNSLTTAIDVKATLGTQAGIQTVWKWDAANAKWAFYSPALDATAGALATYAGTKGYNVLATINPGEGYWVNASAPVSLGTASGTGFPLAASNLVTGWNLVATGDDVAPATFTATVGNITTQWAWDNANSAWYFYAPALAANSTLAGYITSKGYKDFGALTLGKGLGFWVNYAGATAGGGTGGTGGTTPTVSGFSPTTGAAGASVTISGANLGSFTPAPLVKFGATTASSSLVNGQSVTATVPANLATGNSTITISNGDGTGAITVGTFNVTAASGGGTSTVTCTTPNLLTPTAAELTGWARYSTGLESNTANNTSSAASFLLNADGTASYNGAAYSVSNICIYPLTGYLSIGDPATNGFMFTPTIWYGKAPNGNSVTGAIGLATGGTGVPFPVVGVQMGGTRQGSTLALTGTISTLSSGFNQPYGLTTDGSYLYLAEAGTNTIRSIDSKGGVTVVAGQSQGFADGTRGAASFDHPKGITSDGANLYVADTNNNKIRKIVIATGVVTTLAGPDSATCTASYWCPYGGADGTGSAARFDHPVALTTDGTNVYVADAGNAIRKIVIATGQVTTLAASFHSPQGITTDGVNLYVVDSGDNAFVGNQLIRKIVIATGEVSTLAGSLNTLGAANGVGAAASFNNPYGITTDGTYLYVSDTYSNTIRKIRIASGLVSTVAISGGAALNRPVGLTSDGTSLYVADWVNMTIRKISGNTVVPPAAPATVTATASGTSQINLSWAAVSGATGYYVFRSTKPGAPLNAMSMLGATPVASNSYSDTNVAHSTAYYYRVTAADATGESLPSAEATATTSTPAGILVGGTLQGVPLSLTGAVSTLAGAGTVGAVDSTGTSAAFYRPGAITGDGTNLYVADTSNNKIRKIVIATGAVSTLAGSGTNGAVDATGVAATFNQPSGITTDGVNLYVSDTGNNKIRKIVIATGAVTTLAGSGAALNTYTSGSDGTGAAATFNLPTGITTDGINLYVADKVSNKIRKIVIASAQVTSVAGNGYSQFADGTGAAAAFFYPQGITTDGSNLYVSDTGNNKVRQIVIATGAVTTLATVTSPLGITTDGTNLYVASSTGNAINQIVIATKVVSSVAGSATGAAGATNGTGTGALFSTPSDITSDGSNLYVADTVNNKIRKIQGTAVTPPASPSGIVATEVSRSQIDVNWTNITGATAYNVYRSTKPNVLRVAANKITKAAPLASGPFADSGLPAATTYYYLVTAVYPTGESLGSPEVAATTGAVQPGTQMGGTLQGTPLGLTTTVTTLAGSGTASAVDATGAAATFNSPYGITSDGANLYVADSVNNKIRRVVIATGDVTTLAGSGAAGSADGVGAAATFYYPYDVTTDGTNLYVADNVNNKIRKIVIATGDVTTLAGSGGAFANDGKGTAASFNRPASITTDGINLYVADSGSMIRKVVIATGDVTTLAGSGATGASDGTGAGASFSAPFGITTDGTNLYVTEYSNNKIRKVVIASGEVTTFAGSGTLGAVDATGTAASFNKPWGITTDGTNLYVVDSGNNKIRKIVIATKAVTTLAGSGTAGTANAIGTAATFKNPIGVTTDGVNVYVADAGNNKIRKLSVGGTVPAAPTSVSVTVNSSIQISVNWANVTGATAYNIYRSTSPYVQLIAGNKITTSTQPTAGPFADSGLTAATTYYYKVTAINTTGESAASAEVSAMTPAVVVPSAPTSVAAITYSATEIGVSWAKVPSTATYNIYRSTSPNVQTIAGNKIATSTQSTVGLFVDSGLTATTAYYYKVTAVNSIGESIASAEVSATTGGICTATGFSTPITLSTGVGSLALSGNNGATIVGATTFAPVQGTTGSHMCATAASWTEGTAGALGYRQITLWIPEANAPTPYYSLDVSYYNQQAGGTNTYSFGTVTGTLAQLGVTVSGKSVIFNNSTLNQLGGTGNTLILNGTVNMP